MGVEEISTLELLLSWKKEVEGMIVEARKSIGAEYADKTRAAVHQVSEVREKHQALLHEIDSVKFSMAEKMSKIEKDVEEKIYSIERSGTETIRMLSERIRNLETRIANFIFIVTLIMPIVTILVSVLVKKLWK